MPDTTSNSDRFSPPDLDRPAGDDASIYLREDARQLLISREDFPRENAPNEDDLKLDDPDNSSNESSAPDDSETHKEGGKRGRIGGFSSSARRRQREFLHTIDRSADALFATLTYHDYLPGPDEVKRDIDTFGKRLLRKFPGVSATWKLEPQERGYPHLHLLIFGVNYIDAQWLSGIWHDVTNETSSEHRKSGVDVEGHVNLDGKIQTYVAKYMDETYDGWPIEDESWQTMGRWWGVIGRSNLPIVPWADWKVHLEQHDAIQLITELLEEWDVDIPAGVVPPSLLINCRGVPTDRLDRLLDRLED